MILEKVPGSRAAVVGNADGDSVTTMDRAARGLLRLQYALTVGLLIACGAAALADGAPAGWQVSVMLLFLGCFVVGASRLGGQVTGVRATGLATTGWLLAMTAAWLVLVVISPANVWIAFSLWLLGGLVLRLVWAMAYAAATLVVVLAAPAAVAGAISPGEVIGPVIGATCAIAIARGYRRLAYEAATRQDLVHSLLRAQQESDALHAQMAQLQREAGILAERTRLSRDIHDTVAQGFASILLTARAAAPQAKDAELHAMLTRIEQTATEGLEESRRVVADLAPADLTEAGLVASLRRVVDTYGADVGVATTFHAEGDLSGLPTPVEVALLRTAQGALANVRQHARATRIGVSLAGFEDSVRMDIADDGIGFDPHQLNAAHADGSGYGLRSARARLREMGGDLEIESTPGHGSTITAVLARPQGHGS